MNSLAGRRSLAALMSWAVGVRLFSAASMDGVLLMNSGWLSAVLAFLATLPLMLMIAAMSKPDTKLKPIALLDAALCPLVRRAFCLILCAFSLYELAISARLLTFSAQYSALDHHSTALLIGSSIGGAFLACASGGAGLSGSALTWRPLYYSIIALVAVVLLQSVNPLWLTPILGPGLGVIVRGGASFAGMQTALVAGWLCFSGESGESMTGGKAYPVTGPYLMPKTLIRSALVSTGMIAITSMLAPAMPGAPTERDFNLEHFIANGRNVNTLQFPMMLTWFLCQMIMLGYYMYTAAVLLGDAVPGITYRWRLVIVTAIGTALTVSPVASRIYIDDVNIVRYFVVAGIVCAFFVGDAVKRRCGRHAHV